MHPIGISVLATGLFAGFISICLTPIIIRIAKRRGWYDDQNDPRKIHNGRVPRLGGVAMFWAYVIAVSAAALAGVGKSRDSAWGPMFLPFTLSLTLMHGLGLIDDFRNVRARVKFTLQSVVAILVIALDFRFRILPLPGLLLELGWFSYPLTYLWIVGIMNAVNMIDGLDGLAGGISIIAAFAYGVIYAKLGLLFPALAAFALVGSISGFLVFNFPKAKVFMGDSGSLFLGFLLAMLPLLHKSEYPVQAGIFPAITVMLIPIYDVFAAILRRLRRKASIMEPDRQHLHHKLLDLGYDNRQILGFLYGSCIFLAGISLGGLFLPPATQFWLILGVWALGVAAFWYLHTMWHRCRRAGAAAEEPAGAATGDGE